VVVCGGFRNFLMQIAEVDLTGATMRVALGHGGKA
jgi:hypothetical protein